MTHRCYLCAVDETNTSICATCAEDLEFLKQAFEDVAFELPAPTASEEEVRTWAKQHNITVTRCGKKGGE